MSQLTLSALGWLSAISLLLAILCAVSFIAYKWWHGYLIIAKCCQRIPTYRFIPIITYWQILWMAHGSKYPRVIIFQLMCGLCKLFQQEGIALLWIGFRPFVFIYKSEIVEAVLNNSIHISKAVEYDFLKPWLETGLITSTGEKWRSHRKLLTSSFHFKILENFLSPINEQSSILTKNLEIAIGQPWIDIESPITMFTLDTICQTAMGVLLNAQSGQCEEYVNAINELSDGSLHRLMRPWLWSDAIFFYCFPSGWRYRQNVKNIKDFTMKVIKEKKEYMMRQSTEMSEDTAKPKKKALLELLLEHHLKDDNFTEENIREEVSTFMFAGHDTTSAVICWSLYELGWNSEIQEKVLQELHSIFDNDVERSVSLEDLNRMKYLECVIKESLRLYPPVAFTARQLKEDLKVKDYTLSSGCTVAVITYMLHKDPQQFPQPEVFDPDRFLSENNCKRHPFAFIPFSAGPRNCIGQRFALMQVKTVLAHILRRYKVTSLDPRDKLGKMVGLILKNAEPIRIKLMPRIMNDS